MEKFYSNMMAYTPFQVFKCLELKGASNDELHIEKLKIDLIEFLLHILRTPNPHSWKYTTLDVSRNEGKIGATDVCVIKIGVDLNFSDDEIQQIQTGIEYPELRIYDGLENLILIDFKMNINRIGEIIITCNYPVDKSNPADSSIPIKLKLDKAVLFQYSLYQVEYALHQSYMYPGYIDDIRKK